MKMPDRFSRCIFHVDMDAFFASVEQRERPELRGRAVIVGGDGRRGVVAAASYEARIFGVRSAMPAARARRLCPNAVFVRPRHDLYRAVSSEIFSILRQFSDSVEGLSLDEAFLDMTEACSAQSALEPARRIKARISHQTALAASIGIGGCKLIAKLASAWDKPDGLTMIVPGREREFLDPLPVRRLPGVGPATGTRLADLGILTIGQLRCADPGELNRLFGAHAIDLLQCAAAIDDRPVNSDRTRKAISQERTFEHDLEDEVEIGRVIEHLAGRCAQQLTRRGLYACSIHLKLRSGGFSTLSRSRRLTGYTRSGAIIGATAREMAAAWMEYQSHVSVRLIGVGVSSLTPSPPAEELL